MIAVVNVNRTMSTAGRNSPRASDAFAPKLVLAQAIKTGIPAHCDESENVTRMADAVAWRAKVVGMGRAFLVDRYLRTFAWFISFQQK